jgi:hypothetical protein
MQKKVSCIFFNNVYLNFFQLNHDLLVQLNAIELKLNEVEFKFDSNSVQCI